MTAGAVFLWIIDDNSIASLLKKIGLICFKDLETGGLYDYLVKAKNKHTCDFFSDKPLKIFFWQPIKR